MMASLALNLTSKFFHQKTIFRIIGQHSHLHIGVVGAPFDKGQPRQGTSMGPDVLRSSGIIQDLRSLGHQVHDNGNVSDHIIDTNTQHPKVKNWGNVAAYNKLVSEKTCEVSRDGRKVLVLGGDHSIGIGTVHGHLAAHPNACLLWVDAHADINTVESTPSGNMHGMPLSFVVKELSSKHHAGDWNWLKHKISARNVAFIGLRDVDQEERKILDDLGICALSMEEVDQLGIKEATRFALSQINPEGNRPLHVSYDVDALDPSEAPSTGTAVRGGLTLREGITMLEIIHKTGQLSALDIVEVNPLIGTKENVNHTVEAARRLVLAAFGNCRRGNRS